MNTKTIRFTANEQCLELVGEPLRLADDTVNYIEAVFELGENWSGFDSVSAVWYNGFKTIATVLDAQGTCFVPAEVLSRPSKVNVNLVGTIVNGDEVEARLTTAPVLAVHNETNARVSGAETQPVTPSQFDQFVAQVAALVASVKDIDSVVLNDDYTLTINFSDGTSTTVGPIRGAQGEQGIQGETGATGATGNGISSIAKTGTSGSVDTYTITFTDGTTTTFTVTNGEVSLATLETLLPTDTASGAIASLPDGQAVFGAKSVLVDIEPVQSGSGTPSPSNVRPITGWTGVDTHRTGVNVWDEEWELGTYNMSTGASAASNYNIRGKNRMSVKPNTQYYGNNTYIRWLYFDADDTFISSEYGGGRTITTPSNCCYLRIFFGDSYGTTYKNDISINYPSTDHNYHAYHGTSYHTDLGRTVYGGTLDVVSGVLRVTHGIVDMGSLNWAYRSNLSGFSAPLSPTAKDYFNAICSAYSYGGGYYGLGDKMCGYVYDNQAFVKDSDYTDETAFKTAVTGQTFCYELATPTTYQLTPQEVQLLTGTNNVWADTGDVEVTYTADIERYITKKINALI